MLAETLDNLSELLSINPEILPNIITLIVVVLLIAVSLKSQLSWTTLLTLYGIAMVILELLGIDSVFNIITIIRVVVNELIDDLFLGVLPYGN